jgi:hypothetical protein
MYFKPLPSLDYVLSRLNYDPDTGVFRWKTSDRDRFTGEVAGCVNPRGYRQIVIEGITYMAHRLAWLISTGEEPVDQIDHIDTERDNNRFSNLRQATCSENQRNRGILANNSSGATGVYLNKRRMVYRATIKLHGKSIHLGEFYDIVDAIAARREAAIKVHGEFAHPFQLDVPER